MSGTNVTGGTPGLQWQRMLRTTFSAIHDSGLVCFSITHLLLGFQQWEPPLGSGLTVVFCPRGSCPGLSKAEQNWWRVCMGAWKQVSEQKHSIWSEFACPEASSLGTRPCTLNTREEGCAELDWSPLRHSRPACGWVPCPRFSQETRKPLIYKAPNANNPRTPRCMWV